MLADFADELKSTRLKKGISLEEMSAKTRIDIKFLEAIDNGNFSFLPELYVKAFIKEYAKVIELNEDEVIKRYNEAREGILKGTVALEVQQDEKTKTEKPPIIPKTVDSITPVNPITDESKTNRAYSKIKNFRILIYVAGVVTMALIIFISFFNKSSKVIVEEKPYEKVLEETSERYAPQEKKENKATQTSVSDSLVLRITNVDSVDSAWVMIIYDDKRKEDFLLYPKRVKTVKALENFKFTLGNSGVISLILNNQPLSFNGAKGAVRHYMVTADTVERLSSPPILNSN